MLSDPTFHRITNANNCANTLHSQAFSTIYFLRLHLFYFSSDQMFCLLSLSILLFFLSTSLKICICLYFAALSFLYPSVILVCVCISLHQTGNGNVILPIHSFHQSGFKNRKYCFVCFLPLDCFFVFFCFLFFKSLFLTDTAAPDAASLTICSHIFWCPPFFLFF